MVTVYVRVVAGELDKVDQCGPQPLQRVLDLTDDPAARVAAAVGILAHRHVDLAREHDVVAFGAGHRLADDDLGLALRVDIGGVGEVDAHVERAGGGSDALVVILWGPVTGHHGPQAPLAVPDARAAPRAVVPFLVPLPT